MIPIQQLLARFKGLTNTDKIKKEQIVAILSARNIPVDTKQITLNRKTIQIKAAPIIKTEILLKKEEILSQVNRNLGDAWFTTIQ